MNDRGRVAGGANVPRGVGGGRAVGKPPDMPEEECTSTGAGPPRILAPAARPTAPVPPDLERLDPGGRALAPAA